MHWKDYEKEKPSKKGMYLCQVWGFSINHYGKYSEFRVEAFNGETFWAFPRTEYDKNELICFEKILWWCTIDDPPINENHYDYSKYNTKNQNESR